MAFDPRIVGQVAGLYGKSREFIAKHLVKLAFLVSVDGAKSGIPSITIEDAIKLNLQICSSDKHPGKSIPCSHDKYETRKVNGLKVKLRHFVCPECGEKYVKTLSYTGTIRSISTVNPSQ